MSKGIYLRKRTANEVAKRIKGRVEKRHHTYKNHKTNRNVRARYYVVKRIKKR
jgi:hypothetical protein